MITNKFFFRILFSIVVLLFIAITGIAFADEPEYTVRVIFFKPFDVEDTPQNIGEIMGDIQGIYKDQMNKNEHGDKTFKLERNINGNVVVHIVKGQQKAVNYSDNTWFNVMADMPDKFDSNKNIHVIILGGIERFHDVPGMGWPVYGGRFCNEFYGGYVLVAEHNELTLKYAIAHNLGHAFGLYHNLVDKFNTLMGRSDDFDLHVYETGWLKNNHYFNDEHVFNCAPSVVRLNNIEMFNKTHLQLSGVVEDDTELYMAKIMRTTDLAIVGWHFLEGKLDEMRFDVSRELLEDVKVLDIHLIDEHGNYLFASTPFGMPPVPDFPDEPKSVSPKGLLPTIWGDLKTQ